VKPVKEPEPMKRPVTLFIAAVGAIVAVAVAVHVRTAEPAATAPAATATVASSSVAARPLDRDFQAAMEDQTRRAAALGAEGR